MHVEEIKAKLKRYRFIAGEINDLLDERERLRSLAEKITPTLSFAPVHGGENDRMTDTAANIVELEKYIESKSKDLLAARLETERLIDLIDNPKHRQLLVRRYVLGERWEEICSKLNYSWQGMHKVHGRILNEVAQKSR